MARIMLCCQAGMSTSLLVERMKQAAEKRGIEAEIWAAPEAEVSRYVDKLDVLLLGPQVRFMKAKLSGVVAPKPIDVIDMRAYGSMDGDKVLNQALKLIGEA